jgi:hypothetical protein
VIETFAQLVPRGLLDRSGSVFYSGRTAFSGSRSLYLLGVNPGGDPVKKVAETVRSHTDKVQRQEPDNWSAYRDESWEGAAPGTWRMQPRVLHCLRRIGLDPGLTPASNVVFVRSRRQDTLDGNLRDLAEACWPFHRRVIEELKTRVILCFGQSAGKWVCDHVGAKQVVEQYVEQNNRRWTSTSLRSNDGITVIVATHPSIADWTSSATDPTELLRRAIGA